MRLLSYPVLHAVPFFLAISASAAEPAKLTVTLDGLTPQGHIDPKFAFCAPDALNKTKDGGNVSPELQWSEGPEGTKSYAVIMHDPDVPASFKDANKEGKTLPEKMPRKDFVHWVLVNIPADIIVLPKGADSDRLERQGKRSQRTAHGVRGLNDYGRHMPGTFFGYDGPCPPWNDERLHHYTFTVYALDVPNLKLSGPFIRRDALRAMEGHVLAQGQAVGTYTQNPALAAAR